MREEEIIENLHKTVLEATEVLKELIITNETLEQENKELMHSLFHYEQQYYKLKKILLSLNFDKENKN